VVPHAAGAHSTCGVGLYLELMQEILIRPSPVVQASFWMVTIAIGSLRPSTCATIELVYIYVKNCEVLVSVIDMRKV
jgi:hypothetical protein